MKNALTQRQKFTILLIKEMDSYLSQLAPNPFHMVGYWKEDWIIQDSAGFTSDVQQKCRCGLESGFC
jgi:hypothetical protein